MTAEEVVADGYIIFDIRVLEQYANPVHGMQDVWLEEIQTMKFEFKDIDCVMQHDWGMGIRLKSDANGQQEVLRWPWKYIQHVSHVTNSTEVSEALQKEFESEQISHYVEEALPFIEQLANGMPLQEGIGPHVHDTGEGPAVSHGFETPCGHVSAVRAEAGPVWTCLTCASQWLQDQEGWLDG